MGHGCTKSNSEVCSTNLEKFIHGFSQGNGVNIGPKIAVLLHWELYTQNHIAQRTVSTKKCIDLRFQPHMCTHRLIIVVLCKLCTRRPSI